MKQIKINEIYEIIEEIIQADLVDLIDKEALIARVKKVGKEKGKIISGRMAFMGVYEYLKRAKDGQ